MNLKHQEAFTKIFEKYIFHPANKETSNSIQNKFQKYLNHNCDDPHVKQYSVRVEFLTTTHFCVKVYITTFYIDDTQETCSYTLGDNYESVTFNPQES